MTNPSTPPAAARLLPGLAPALLLCLLLAPGPASAQFEAGADEITEDAILTTYPTIDGIRAARRAGHPPERILKWIQDQGAVFSLDLDTAMQLHAEGLETGIIAAMAGKPADQVASLLKTFESVYVARPGPREGLSERHLRKMLEYGAPEEEILHAIAEEGSRAEISLDEAVELMDQGASPRLVVAMARGLVPPESAAPPPPADAPLLDDILSGAEPGAGDDAEEAMALGDIFEEEGLATGPEGAPRLVVVADPAGSQVFLAPGNIRPADMLEMPTDEGRGPVALQVPPGLWWVLVEKPIDEYDASIIPAMRTVHDGDGSTRTLIHEGAIYYDAKDCCLPRGLAGPVKITRIAEDQPGMVMGDEFEGMPPYLWDGNRYLILHVRKGRIVRVMKAYAVKRAAGEERTVTATFIPTVSDPLEYPASMEGISTRARSTWEVPSEEAMKGLLRLHGIPGDLVSPLRQRLLENGKATWRGQSSAGIRLVTLELQSLGRISISHVELDRSGPFGTLATPGGKEPMKPAEEGQKASGAKGEDKETGQAEAGPKPLPAITRDRTPDSGLPVLEIANQGKSAVMVTLEDGTSLFVAAGDRVASIVSPGTTLVRARYDAEGGRVLQGTTRFSYNSSYRLVLD